MLFAVLNGNGSMAQFNHPEFGGSGQWMKGGMLMLGDMFNYSLKGSIDALCSERSQILAEQPGLLRSGSFQSQSQGGGAQQSQVAGAPIAPDSTAPPAQEADVFSAIERLADSRAKGILTDEEFAQKKSELLERL